MATITIFTIVVLIALTGAFEIRLQTQRYKQMFADVKNILEQRENCHAHLLIVGAENFETSLSFPYYLTIPDGQGYKVTSSVSPTKKMSELLKQISNSTFPSLVTSGTCLVNAFIVTKTWTPTAAYFIDLNIFMLKQRSNNLLAPVINVLFYDDTNKQASWTSTNKDQRFFRGFLWEAAGAVVSYALGYSNEISNELKVNARYFTVVCSYCEKTLDFMPCATGNGHGCFEENYQAHQTLLNEGKNIQWVSGLSTLVTQKPPGKWATCELYRHEKEFSCMPHVTLTQTVYDFLTQSLNFSRRAFHNKVSYRRTRALPRVGWTRDTLAELDSSASGFMLFTHQFPLDVDSPRSYSIRFITVEAGRWYDSRLVFFSQQFQYPVWLSTLTTVAILGTLAAAAGSQFKSLRSFLTLTGHWIFRISSVLVDQVEMDLTIKSKSLQRFLVAILCFAIALGFVVGNLYKGMFSTEITVDLQDYSAPVHRLDNLDNYFIYHPQDHRVLVEWKQNETVVNNLLKILGGNWECVISLLPSPPAICILSKDVPHLLMAEDMGDCQPELAALMVTNVAGSQPFKSRHCGKTLQLLVNLFQRSKFVPVENISKSIIEDIRRHQRIAIVATEEHLPTLWNQLETFRRENNHLTFKHNLNSSEDTSLPRRRDKIFVSSGLGPEYTQLVTRSAHALLQSGIWEFWARRMHWVMDKSVLAHLQPENLGGMSITDESMTAFWAWVYFSMVHVVIFLLQVSLIDGRWKRGPEWLKGKGSVAFCASVQFVASALRTAIGEIKSVIPQSNSEGNSIWRLPTMKAFRWYR